MIKLPSVTNGETKMNRLQEILSTMDIPELRKNDMRWLLRNMSVRNSKHPDFQEALMLIRETILKG